MTTRFTLLLNRLKYSAFYGVDAANLPKVAAGRLAVAGALWHDFWMSVHASSSLFSNPYDVIIVGAGPTGSLVALRMAAKGLSVLVLEAGQRFGGHNALLNSEANAGKIMWSEPRNHVGLDFVVPKAGMGVGGGTLPWLGVMPRFHRDDFRTRSTEGVGDDWPISYDDLRPHYERVEREFGTAGVRPVVPSRRKLSPRILTLQKPIERHSISSLRERTGSYDRDQYYSQRHCNARSAGQWHHPS